MNSIIKLTNGETIIAEVVHEDETTTSVLEPLALSMEESESGRPMMVAMSWVPLTKKINMVNLKSSHVVAIYDCDEPMNEYYQRSLDILKGNEIGDETIDLDDNLEEPHMVVPEVTANTVH